MAKHKKNPKRVKAGKKAYKKSGLYKFNLGRKKHSKGTKKYKKKKYGFVGAKARHRARKRASAAAYASRQMTGAVAKSYEAKGYNKAQAHELARRYVRLLKHRAARAAAGPTSEERVAAAMQASMGAGHSYPIVRRSSHRTHHRGRKHGRGRRRAA